MGRVPDEFKPFLRLLGHHWRRMAPGTISGLVALLSAVGLLALSGWFISAAAFAGLSAVAAQNFNFFFPSIGVRIFAFARTAARYGERVFSHDATFRILESLRSWFYRHLEPLAPARLMQFRSGDLLNRIVEDIDALDNLYLRVLSPTIVASFFAALLFGFIWIFNPLIAVIATGSLAFAGITVSMAAHRAGRRSGRHLTHLRSGLRTQLVESLQGMPELLVYGAHASHLSEIRRVDAQLIREQKTMSRISGLSSACLTLCSGLAVVLVLYIGVDQVHGGTMNGAILALVTLAALAAFETVLPLPMAFQYLGRTRESAKRLLEIVDSAPAVEFPVTGSRQLHRPDLVFEEVDFRYTADGPPVLSDFSAIIPYGSRIALLGQTGSGKSTLIHLLVRFWDPVRGRICVDDRNIREYSETDLHGLFSVVSQQPHMFGGTLRENLRLARPDASDSDLLDALDTARMIDFVQALPDGLDTWIGEAGKMISGGQVRRLAIARAVLQDNPVWILDEPTEGLDPDTERQMMRRIETATLGKTVILATHRLVDMDRMDRILLMEGGTIAEDGTHEELMAEPTRYAAMYERLRI